MKAKESLFLLLSGITAFTVLMTGCVKQPDYSGPDDNGQGGGNGFDYATVADVKINVDYSMKGNKAVFEVFAENPVIEKDGLLVRKEGVKSLLKAYTDRDSRYSGVVNLPTATDRVWLYSESYGLPTCVETQVTASGISFNLDFFLEDLASQRKDRTAAAAQASLTRGGSTPDNILNVQTPLGGYDIDGKPDYLEKNAATVPDGLMNRVQNVLLPGTNNSQYALPAEKVNIEITQEASLKLVFLSELSQWANAIGYYYYETGHAPKTLQEFLDLPKYVALPNCSMYNGNYEYPGYTPPLKPGMQVRLKYFGQDGQPSDKFPAGITVGWFIMPSGFKISWGQLILPTNFGTFKSSNSDFNNYQEKVCVSLYDKASGKTVIGFEDGADSDYKDVLFYLDADPKGGIDDSDKPVIDPGEEYPDITGDPIEGTLAFEDLWPSQGDYDMNDVMVRSDYEKVFNEKGVFEESFMLKTFANFAGNANGLAVTLTGAAADAKLEFSVRKPGAETFEAADFERDGKVVLLTPDVKETMGATYRITAKYDAPVAEAQAGTIKPFIYRTDRDGLTAGKRWEVHIPYEAPTARAEMSFFGTNDDKSIPEKGIYYVRAENYPFAFFLSGANDGDVAKLLDQTNEKSPIDQVYPAYAEWAATNGEKNKDWYKK